MRVLAASLLSLASVTCTYVPHSLSSEQCAFLTDDDCMRRDTAFYEHARKLRNLQDSIGNLNVLVIPMQWSDHPSERILPSVEDLDELWNGVGISDVIPSGSIANYTNVNSHGKLKLTATVVDWLVTDNTEIYYADGRSGAPTSDSGAVHMEEAVDAVLTQLEDSGFDFSPFDQDGDSLIDVVAILHSGHSAELGGVDCLTQRGQEDRIRSYATSADTSNWRSIDGYRLGSFVVASAFRGMCNSNMARLGVITHEFIHTLNIPDLYDLAGPYNNAVSSVGGLGGYDIMANPFGQQNSLAWPGHLSPWTKFQLGWITPMEITEDGTYSLRPAELYPDAYIISSPYPDGEYLLIEVRRPLLFDSNIWDNGGILIYHIDENSPGWGNYNRGFPGMEGNSWPGNLQHYEVALMQRDGQYDLEQALNNGHIDDFWLPGMDLSLGPGNGEQVANSAEYPNTDSYAYGAGISVTGITITNFLDTNDGGASFEVTGMPTASAPVTAPVSPPSSPPTLSPTISPVAAPVDAPVPSPIAEPTSPTETEENPTAAPSAVSQPTVTAPTSSEPLTPAPMGTVPSASPSQAPANSGAFAFRVQALLSSMLVIGTGLAL